MKKLNRSNIVTKAIQIFKMVHIQKKKKIKNKQTNKTALSPKELSAKSFVIKF